jgi:hypothetical protein
MGSQSDLAAQLPSIRFVVAPVARTAKVWGEPEGVRVAGRCSAGAGNPSVEVADQGIQWAETVVLPVEIHIRPVEAVEHRESL